MLHERLHLHTYNRLATLSFTSIPSAECNAARFIHNLTSQTLRNLAQWSHTIIHDFLCILTAIELTMTQILELIVNR